MDLMTILLIVGVALIAAGLTYLLIGRKVDNSAELTEIQEKEKQQAEKVAQLQKNLDEKQAELQKAKAELASVSSELSSLSSKLSSVEASHEAELKQLQHKLEEQANAPLTPELTANLDKAVQEKLAAAEQLRKQVKRLEEEVEELEDDLESNQKKLKTKVQECAELEERAQQAERAKQQLDKDNEKLQGDLKQKEQENKLKAESIDFVAGILSAPKANDASTTQLHERVNAIVDFVRGELQPHIDRYFNARVNNPKEYEEVFGTPLDTWAIYQKKSWLQGKTTIAFVGEFSAGKTSIVNRILDPNSPKPILPVSAKATTAIPTYISGGKNSPKSYKFVTPDNEEKILTEETFNLVKKEVLKQLRGVSSLIRYFVMRYNNPLLENLSILDTPGFSSTDKEDAERTIDVINECDALFWVIDVNSGEVNEKSLELIREHLQRPLYVVINKCDTKADSEVQKVEKKIRDSFHKAGVSVEGYIRFSAKAPLANIMKPIQSIKRSADSDNYLQNLQQELNESLTEFKTAVNEAKKEVDEQTALCDNITENFIRHLRRAIDFSVNASNLPTYNERFFHENDYRLSQTEYNQMTRNLEDIVKITSETLPSCYDEQVDARIDHVVKHTELYERQQCYEEMQHLYKKLEKLIKQLNQVK